MKKMLAVLLAGVMAAALGMPAAALEEVPGTTEEITVSVRGQVLELSGLPRPPYREGETVMVPLRAAAEALGYQVTWDPVEKTAAVDDGQIQRAILRDGSAAAAFEGKLQIIDMTRQVENAAATVIRGGHTYVPAEFFREFFNDVEMEGSVLSISPGMAQLAQ